MISVEKRHLVDLKDVLYDKRWLKKAENFEVYSIQRGVKEKNDLRYDITIIPPKMLGKEFVKTKGHLHIGKYPELFVVLEGEVIFLLQKMSNSEIKDVYAVFPKKGEKIIVPFDYYHLTINPANKLLKLGNWINKNSKNNYQFFEKMQGACYYYTKDGWVKNRNYKKIPKLTVKAE